MGPFAGPFISHTRMFQMLMQPLTTLDLQIMFHPKQTPATSPNMHGPIKKHTCMSLGSFERHGRSSNLHETPDNTIKHHFNSFKTS